MLKKSIIINLFFFFVAKPVIPVAKPVLLADKPVILHSDAYGIFQLNLIFCSLVMRCSGCLFVSNVICKFQKNAAIDRSATSAHQGTRAYVVEVYLVAGYAVKIQINRTSRLWFVVLFFKAVFVRIKLNTRRS